MLRRQREAIVNDYKNLLKLFGLSNEEADLYFGGFKGYKELFYKGGIDDLIRELKNDPTLKLKQNIEIMGNDKPTWNVF